ncbi:MAG: Ger(x)C family spore germination protein [Firmicutes bacterium]|nr:Ger(x)C family spore germination protein [Bacillota bacterium]
MKRRLLLIIILFIFMLFVSTGCWDRIEIEEILIIVGLAIDCSENDNSIIITQHYVIPEGVEGGEKVTSTQKTPYANTSVEGTSVVEIFEKFKNIKSRRPNYEHLKVIIISDKVVQSYNLYKLLNAILRHPEIPRNTNILISEGEARLFFEIAPNLEDIPAFNIMMLSSNTKYKPGMPPTQKLGDISEKMAGSKSFTIQRIAMRNGIQSPRDIIVTETTAGKGDIFEVRGAAVIKGDTYMLAGWLDEKETYGLNWISGKVESGIVKIEDKDTGQTIVYEIHNVNTKIRPKVLGNNISFTVESKIEGTIAEDWVMTSNAFEDGFIEKVELAAEKEVKGIMEKTINKIQKELKADVAGFGKQLHIKYPAVWEEVKDNWEEIFSKATVDINVKPYVRDFGRKSSYK